MTDTISTTRDKISLHVKVVFSTIINYLSDSFMYAVPFYLFLDFI